ncbi:MAG TPA: dienelactone hydrolase family protein [Caulobacteraceae bacterium]|nr:dienelactone hydrolase family protein [Caulobacteraceae bacterium]
MTDLSQLDGPRVLPASGGAPKQIVILVHGYGSNGHDLIGLAPALQPALPDAVFVSPHAPQRMQELAEGYQWWPINTFSMQERAEGAKAAAPVLNAFIDQELERYGLSEDKLALVGFSQGTMMSLYVGPQREKQIAGIVGYSGMVVDEAALKATMKTKPPVLLAHGDADPVVPFAAFHHAGATLQGLGFEVFGYQAKGVGHSIDNDGLRLGRDFLVKVLG